MPASPRRRSAARTGCAAVITLALAACSSDGLDVEGFSPGPCSDTAPVLQEVDEALREVGEDDLEPGAAAERFREAQEVLKQARAGAVGAQAEGFRDLVTQLGFFRIAVDTGTYDGSQDEDVRAALDALAEDCRGS
jgi:hypothetical protein